MNADQLEWGDPPATKPQAFEGRVKALVTVLASRPGEWAKYPHPYSASSVRYMVNKYPQRYPGTEWCSRTVNGEKVLWARWVGDA